MFVYGNDSYREGKVLAHFTVLALAALKPGAIAIDAIRAGCGGGIIAQGWSVRVTADGTVMRSVQGLVNSPPGKEVVYHVPPERADALFKQAESAGLLTQELNEGGEMRCTLGLSAAGKWHILSWGASPGPAATKAKEIFDAAVAMAPTGAQ